MEILDLRHFASEDLRPLLAEESEHWLRLLRWDYSGSGEMILRYLDARILPGYAAVHGGRVCGYSFFVYEGSKGIIGDLFVGRAAQLRNGASEPVESVLLTHVIETLQQSPGMHRIEAQLLPHPKGAITRPFQETGFRAQTRLYMALELEGALAQAPPPPPEIAIRPWREDDFQPAAAIITAAYRDHVDSEINDQYRTMSGALRFLNNIVRFPGCGIFDEDSSLVAVHRDTGLMVGLILCSRVKNDVGHVTQVCLLPEHKGRGLGLALMAAAKANLSRRRFATLSLTVTEANTSAVDLYRKMGFRIAHVFEAFVWEG